MRLICFIAVLILLFAQKDSPETTVIKPQNDTVMDITRKSILTGITRTLNLDITPEQLANYNSGMHPIKALPNLNTQEREFVLAGTIDAEWDAGFEPETDLVQLQQEGYHP